MICEVYGDPACDLASCKKRRYQFDRGSSIGDLFCVRARLLFKASRIQFLGNPTTEPDFTATRKQYRAGESRGLNNLLTPV